MHCIFLFGYLSAIIAIITSYSVVFSALVLILSDLVGGGTVNMIKQVLWTKHFKKSGVEHKRQSREEGLLH